MDNIARKNLLFDFYGELLTEHQRLIYEDAVCNDCSLSELAEEYDISRQGIHDLLKRCDKILEGYEDKLGLVAKFNELRHLAARIEELTPDEEIRSLARRMIEVL